MQGQTDSSMSHACFTVGHPISVITNACWGCDTEYDTQLCHLFRTVLFHLLAIVKHIAGVQHYYVQQNLELSTLTSLSGVVYRMVNFTFSIKLHPLDRDDSSDDDMKERIEEVEKVDEEEEEEEEYNHPEIDTTYPEWFTRSAQSIDWEGAMTDLDQMRRMATNLNELIGTTEREEHARAMERLEREYGPPREIASVQQEEDRQDVEQRLAELGAIEPVAVAVGVAEEDDTCTVRSFFLNIGSFSSGSEGEEKT